MKRIIHTILLSFFCWVVLQVFLFRHGTPSDLEAVEIHHLLSEDDAFAGQVVRVSGTVTHNWYLASFGAYRLADEAGNSLTILCRGYPPAIGRQVNVAIYMKPMYKAQAGWILPVETRATREV